MGWESLLHETGSSGRCFQGYLLDIRVLSSGLNVVCSRPGAMDELMDAVELEGDKKILLREVSSRNVNLLPLCSRLVGKMRKNLHVCVFHVLNTLSCFFHQREEQVGRE